MARAPLTRSLSSLVIHSQATAADSGGGTMCAHRSFLGAACARSGARPVARMPARPALVCNTLRRVIGAVNLLIVMHFPPRCTPFLPSLPTARRGCAPLINIHGTYGAGRLPWCSRRVRHARIARHLVLDGVARTYLKIA